MKYIFGLGNPGKQYENTRHNIGFASIDYVVTRWLSHQDFVLIGAEKKGSYESWEFRHDTNSCVDPERVYCIKPLTFMNRSGDVVGDWVKYAQSDFVVHNDVWIVHDELDVSFGNVKIGTGGSSAGHNGVQSIIEVLGLNTFVRFRIGIQPDQPPKESMADFVLTRFTPSENAVVEQLLPRVSDALEAALSKGIAKAQMLFHTNKKTSDDSLSA